MIDEQPPDDGEELTLEQIEAEALKLGKELADPDEQLAADLGIEPDRYQAGDGVDDGNPEDTDTAAMLAGALGGTSAGPWLLVPTEDGRQQRVRVMVLTGGGSVVAPPEDCRAVVVVDDVAHKLYLRAADEALEPFDLGEATEAKGPDDLKRMIQEIGE